MNAKIFCCKHKEYANSGFNCVEDIQVGSALSDKNLGILRDDIGQNISVKNPYYNELTATYWAWKNCTADIVGIVHYRRFFNLSSKSHKLIVDFNKISKLCLFEDNVVEIMKDVDCILPKKNFFTFKANEHYKRGWYYEDIEKVLDSIKNNFPIVYPYALRAMNKRWGYCFNMIIAKKSLFDEYANFVFTVLFDIESSILLDLNGRNQYQKRVFGFLAEHLMTIFIEYKKNVDGIKLKECQVSNCFSGGFKEYWQFQKREIRFGIQEFFGIKRY